MVPATMPNGSAIVKRNDGARDTLEVDGESGKSSPGFQPQPHTLGQCNSTATGRMRSAPHQQRRDRASTDLREEVEALHFTIQTWAIGFRRRLLHFCGS
jgi:hypothetical protein